MHHVPDKISDLSDDDADFIVSNLGKIMDIANGLAKNGDGAAHVIYTMARDCRDAMLFDQVSRDVIKKLVQTEPVVDGWIITKTIQDYMRNGQKINAIKELRSTTGLGLKEAKDIIDKAEIDLKIRPVF